jgi:hypothetical protein
LKKLDYLNREQLQKIHRLGKKRNANKVLKELSPFLSNFREEDDPTIYYLNESGREYVNSQKERRKNKFVHHVIMRNDIYIYFGYPHEWKNEMRLKDGEFTVICDAWFKRDNQFHILEVDSLQKMKVNRSKIQQYKGLYKNGAITQHLGYFPKMIWLTTTELRRKQLKELCEGLPFEIYTIDDIR